MFPVICTPKCVAFRSKLTGKYLQSVHEGSEERAGGGGGGKFFFMEVSDAAVNDGDDHVLASPYTRFYLEPSKEHDGLFHVRCCHNNTYWSAKHGGEDGSGHWTIGIVNEPDRDISRSPCTLFEPVHLTDADSNQLSLRFLCPRHQQTESGRAVETDEEAYLHLGSGGGHGDEDKSLHEFCVVELSELVLPKYVVFKGDNNLYLSARVIQRYNYLEYAASDIADPTAVNTIFPEHVGEIVRIKSNHFDRFWRASPNWIWADSTDTTSRNQATRFRVVQVSDYMALQNLGNHKYCIRLSADRKTSCLKAEVSTITQEARIRVEEAVLERQIDNVSFRLSEARIYGETPLSIPSVTSDNRTSQPNNKTLTMEYKVTDTRSFSSTVGLKIGVEVNFRAGIPMIADGKVGMSTEVSTEQAWGKTSEETKTLEAKYEAVVPSMSRVVLRAAATQGFVDVPFSYRQRDVLTTGQVVLSTLHDGLFSGVNSYNFHYETTEERL